MTKPWSNKRVLVVGGSAGLGFHLAAAALRREASVTIVGRDPSRLEDALRRLAAPQDQLRGVAADVTCPQDVDRLASEVLASRQLDVLINAVGMSTRGHVHEATAEDFQRMWEVNVLPAIRVTRRVLPLLIESRGSVVNIGSLASRVATSNLGAYPTSKFALAGYTESLRRDLVRTGVHVLLVCPGPIARADSGNRYAADTGNMNHAANQPGGGARLRLIDPDQLADRILRACEQKKPELVVPGKARWLFAISDLFPQIGDWIVRGRMKGKDEG